ncbi:hypothetical protein SAMN05720766_11015 [Fibrobacter sp. UWH9]|uniref:hypothetical protein n=1 Tax=Fibrobacter sp. UWH9 TaxID=1896213 RepID=UPI0009169B5B|nr:hypothetical protein [Fibrobacter sp. UWH9]SHH31058.1 hypothetical protein SAMN05720766_11015 [Fibrobacter sp. UWH9]
MMKSWLFILLSFSTVFARIECVDLDKYTLTIYFIYTTMEQEIEYGKQTCKNDFGICRDDGSNDGRVFGGWGKIAKAATGTTTGTTSRATAG